MSNSTQVLKSRRIEGPLLPWTSTYTGPGGSTVSGSSKSVKKLEWMRTFNNRAWYVKEKYPRQFHNQDTGNPWEKFDITLTSPTPPLTTRFNTNSSVYTMNTRSLTMTSTTAECHTRVLAEDPQLDYNWFNGVCPVGLSDSAMDQFGSLAIYITNPVNPAADLSVAIGELIHDGIPSLPGKAEGNIGDEYLNLQFGWSPTISDGKAFIRAIHNQDILIHQFIKDNGKQVRRKLGIPPKVTSSKTVSSSNYPPVPLNSGAPWSAGGQEIKLGILETTSVTTQYLWFEGVFTYYLPPNVIGMDIAALDKTYGIVPDINTAWNLLPWSWLVDWFSNAGVVMKNLTAFTSGGLTMPWGYVMCDTETVTDYRWSGQVRTATGTSFVPYSFTETFTTRRRQRRQATPFGFGLNWDGFSPFQLSILAALGISRLL